MEIQGSQLRLPFLLGGDSINKREKEIQQVFLDNEKAVLKKLEKNYEEALAEIDDKIALLLGRQDADQQHVVYQVEFQRSLKAQVSAILEVLHSNEFETISEYLTKSYEDGFITTMYNLQGQGIPLVFPLDQEQIVNAIQHETKLSENLYASLGRDTKELSKKIAGEISRGIAGGQMYAEISRNISSWARIPKNNAMRIARTEMHRIQTKASMDACIKAKSKGADIVRQWDASLDKRTRDSHARVDGEIRELDEKFSNGLMYPGDPSGAAAEVINCRCALLQRARWALGNDYTKWSEDAPVVIDDDGTTQFVKVDANSYKEFKGYYMDITKQMTMNFENGNPKRVRSSVQKIKTLENNGKSSKMKLEDTVIHKSVGAQSKNYDILDTESGEYFHFAEGTKIQNSEVFAGYKVKKPLKEEVAEGLAKEFGGDPKKWQHAKGNGVVNYNGEELKAEVHWFQEETVGKVKFKVKKWLDDEG